jgi:hypothetical protein
MMILEKEQKLMATVHSRQLTSSYIDEQVVQLNMRSP